MSLERWKQQGGCRNPHKKHTPSKPEVFPPSIFVADELEASGNDIGSMTYTIHGHDHLIELLARSGVDGVWDKHRPVPS